MKTETAAPAHSFPGSSGLPAWLRDPGVVAFVLCMMCLPLIFGDDILRELFWLDFSALSLAATLIFRLLLVLMLVNVFRNLFRRRPERMALNFALVMLALFIGIANAVLVDTCGYLVQRAIYDFKTGPLQLTSPFSAPLPPMD